MTSTLPTAGKALAGLAAVALLALAAPAGSRAGDYIVAQCAPGLYPDAPEAGYSTTSSHFAPLRDCSKSSPGMQIRHSLNPGETGTLQGRFGAWVWEAPAGTYLTGGFTHSRLENQDGIYGFLAVSTDAGEGVATENQNDNQLHLSAIPAGDWRFFVARLQCTRPNRGNRCVGDASAAHTFVKQLRLQLTDVEAPSVEIGGSLLDGGTKRGPQQLEVDAGDVGAGLQSVRVKVNGEEVVGEDLSDSCHPLPEGLTSSLSPCPSGVAETYELRTEEPPFVDGTNSIEVCAYDYAQSDGQNSDCDSAEVVTDNLCPGSPVGGGAELRAGFAANGKRGRALRFGRQALIRGKLRDADGNPVANAQVCVLGHTEIPGRDYRLLGTAATNENGGFFYKLNRGASRRLRVAFRHRSHQISTDLRLRVRARATLHLSRRRTTVGRKVLFWGKIAGPRAAKRVVILLGTVPGAKRRFLVRRARTNRLGHFRFRYAFSPVQTKTRFVFWAIVPEQNGYPFARGRSVRRYIRVRP